MKPWDVALGLAERLLYLPYRWGGNDPMTGFDCSGLMVELLTSTGRIPADSDFTAEQLSHLFPTVIVAGPPSGLESGMLVFYGKPKIIHVGMVWHHVDGMVFPLMIEASGNREVTSGEAASARDTFIRVRPVRPGWSKVCDPWAGAR